MTPSRRPRWGAHFAALGLSTALAMTFATPASAQAGDQLDAAVPPVEYTAEVNPDCEDINGFTLEVDTDNAPVDGEVLNFSSGGQNGTITLGVTEGEQGQLLSFDFGDDSAFAAGAVIVKGSNNANIYDYRPTMAGQIEADETLHAPINPSGGFADLSHVAFCIVPDGSNT
ncbi:hypothetical protein [Streptomyces cyaneus]|uniref:hypothetical protein n=1 Tax=Streptomyces cyaneus TaxID=1904 RepID=UPI000FF87D2E|nr:hypothetical protein [Streptomyces cyaneus]